MTGRGFLWAVGALLGIVAAAAIAWSASLLAGQHVALSSEPLSASGRLAPAVTTPIHAAVPQRARRPHPRSSPAPAAPTPAPAVTSALPSAAAPVAPPAAAPSPSPTSAPVAPQSSPSPPVATTPAKPRAPGSEDYGRSGGGSAGAAQHDD